MAQKEGCYPRVNGTMLLSNQYNGMIVSLVGKVVSHGNLQASDGTNVSLSMDFLEGYHFNPDMAVEIIGHVENETNVQVGDSSSLLKHRTVLQIPLGSHFFSPTCPGICRSRPFHRYGPRSIQSNASSSTLYGIFAILSTYNGIRNKLMHNFTFQ